MRSDSILRFLDYLLDNVTQSAGRRAFLRLSYNISKYERMRFATRFSSSLCSLSFFTLILSSYAYYAYSNTVALGAIYISATLGLFSLASMAYLTSHQRLYRIFDDKVLVNILSFLGAGTTKVFKENFTEKSENLEFESSMKESIRRQNEAIERISQLIEEHDLHPNYNDDLGIKKIINS